MSAESLGTMPGGLRVIRRELLGLSPDASDPGVRWFDLGPPLGLPAIRAFLAS